MQESNVAEASTPITAKELLGALKAGTSSALAHKRGFDFQSRTPAKLGLLDVACLAGSAEWARQLLAAGAPTHKPNEAGRLPTFYAAPHCEVLSLLLRAQAPFAGSGFELGDSCMGRALKAGAAKSVRLLIEAGADPEAPLAGGANFAVHVLRGAAPRAEPMLRVLDELGVDWLSDDPRDPPLVHMSSDPEIDVRVPRPGHRLFHANCASPEDWSFVLSRAASAAVDLGALFECNAHLAHLAEHKSSTFCVGLIHWFAIKGRVSGARALVGAGVDPNSKTADGNTPLMLAAMLARAEAARELVDAGFRLSHPGDGKVGAGAALKKAAEEIGSVGREVAAWVEARDMEQAAGPSSSSKRVRQAL